MSKKKHSENPEVEVKNENPEVELGSEDSEQEKEAEVVAEEAAEEAAEPETESEAESDADVTEAVKKAEAALMEKMMRLQADFENYKRRSQKEKADIYSHAMESFLTKLLPVLDNLERAEAAATDNLESYKEGVDMIFKSLLNILNSEGLQEIEAVGKPFDPNFHHGVAVGEDPEQEDQTVLEVFQKGYQFKDKVIRPAMVKVNQN